MSKFKVGDNVRGSELHAIPARRGESGVVTIVSPEGNIWIKWDSGPTTEHLAFPRELELVQEVTQETPKAPVSGGPSKYYDYPFKDWTTGNDMMEYFATEVWGAYSLHFKDIFKAGLRWGNKSGTTEEYDARKIVYSGLRLLGMVAGKEAVADYLKELSEDKQFQAEDS